MSRPNTSPSRKLLLSAITGKPVDGNAPGWMDRKYGYTAKLGRGRNTKKQKKKG